jgi:hypothetical protein
MYHHPSGTGWGCNGPVRLCSSARVCCRSADNTSRRPFTALFRTYHIARAYKLIIRRMQAVLWEGGSNPVADLVRLRHGIATYCEHGHGVAIFMPCIAMLWASWKLEGQAGSRDRPPTIPTTYSHIPWTYPTRKCPPPTPLLLVSAESHVRYY